MRYLASILLLSSLQSTAVAQGVSAPWDVAQLATSLASQAERLRPILDQLTPDQWQSKGAPAAYVAQLKSAKDEVGYLTDVAAKFKQQPERLPLALDTYFRLQSVELQVSTLVEGVRRYQNPAVGDLLVSVMAANAENRDQLRQYIADLAQTKEDEFRVVDQEAQRCRGILTRQPARRPAAVKPAAAAVAPGAAAPKPAPVK
ncbi:MAG: hypothetical protein ABL995_03995 [Bryobacteraceae bacterium]